MAYLVNGVGTVNVSQGTVITLNTLNKYVPNDIQLTMNVATANPNFSGGVLSGNSTATGVNASLSTSMNNGIKIQTAYSAASTAVKYNGATSGWIDKENGAQAFAARTLESTNGNEYYLNGVVLPQPESGTNSFFITVPNGDSMITFLFDVDAQGNVTVNTGETGALGSANFGTSIFT